MLSCKYSARAFLVIGFALGCEKYFCEVQVDLKGVGFSEIFYLFSWLSNANSLWNHIVTCAALLR